MKKCPQCEFIYEDDQTLCDMDGVLLVFDSRTLPNLDALTTAVPAKAQAKRNRAVPVFASLTLALVLGMVYYVSTYRKAVQNADMTPASAASVVNSAPLEQPTPAETKLSEVAQPAETLEQPKVESKATPNAATVPAVRKSTKATPIKTPSETKKEDSKVGSILKKTGRILKKPFKF